MRAAWVVMNRDRTIVHANDEALQCLWTPTQRDAMVFADLPADLKLKVDNVINTGEPVKGIEYHPKHAPESTWDFTVEPFGRAGAAEAEFVLIRGEDVRHYKELMKGQREALFGLSGWLFGEVLSRQVEGLRIFEQLIPCKKRQQYDPGLLEDVGELLTGTLKKFDWMTSKVRSMSSAYGRASADSVASLEELVHLGFQEAADFFPSERMCLKCEDSVKGVVIRANRSSFRHALAEIFLGLVKENDGHAEIGVRIAERTSAGVRAWPVDPWRVLERDHLAAMFPSGSCPPPVEERRSQTGAGISIEIRDNHGELFLDKSHWLNDSCLGEESPRRLLLSDMLAVSESVVCRIIEELHDGKVEFLKATPRSPRVVCITIPVVKS